MFRKNLNIEQYIPMYDYYDEFLGFLLEFIDKKETVDWEKQKDIEAEDAYNFKGLKDPFSRIVRYYKSLVYELKDLT